MLPCTIVIPLASQPCLINSLKDGGFEPREWKTKDKTRWIKDKKCR